MGHLCDVDRVDASDIVRSWCAGCVNGRVREMCHLCDVGRVDARESVCYWAADANKWRPVA